MLGLAIARYGHDILKEHKVFDSELEALNEDIKNGQV